MSSEILIFTKSLTVGTPSPKVTKNPSQSSEVTSVRVLPWGRDEAEAYGRVRAKLEKGGLSLGNMDMMIAAHAIVTGATLVTNDKAFAHINELTATKNWATDL